MERKIIKASDGMVLTNGTIFGRTIYLADGLNESDFYEITLADYERTIAEQETTEGVDMNG